MNGKLKISTKNIIWYPKRKVNAFASAFFFYFQNASHKTQPVQLYFDIFPPLCSVFYYSQNILIFFIAFFAFVSPTCIYFVFAFFGPYFSCFWVFLKKHRFFTITKVPGNHFFDSSPLSVGFWCIFRFLLPTWYIFGIFWHFLDFQNTSYYKQTLFSSPFARKRRFLPIIRKYNALYSTVFTKKVY